MIRLAVHLDSVQIDHHIHKIVRDPNLNGGERVFGAKNKAIVIQVISGQLACDIVVIVRSVFIFTQPFLCDILQYSTILPQTQYVYRDGIGVFQVVIGDQPVVHGEQHIFGISHNVADTRLQKRGVHQIGHIHKQRANADGDGDFDQPHHRIVHGVGGVGRAQLLFGDAVAPAAVPELYAPAMSRAILLLSQAKSLHDQLEEPHVLGVFILASDPSIKRSCIGITTYLAFVIIACLIICQIA